MQLRNRTLSPIATHTALTQLSGIRMDHAQYIRQRNFIAKLHTQKRAFNEHLIRNELHALLCGSTTGARTVITKDGCLIEALASVSAYFALFTISSFTSTSWKSVLRRLAGTGGRERALFTTPVVDPHQGHTTGIAASPGDYQALWQIVMGHIV